MTLSPTKLAAARLAAAEVFIAEGLPGTNYEARGEEALRRAAKNLTFSFGLSYLTGKGSVVVNIRRGEPVEVAVDLEGFYEMSPTDVVDMSAHISRAGGIARKVEAAIAEALR